MMLDDVCKGMEEIQNFFGLALSLLVYHLICCVCECVYVNVIVCENVNGTCYIYTLHPQNAYTYVFFDMSVLVSVCLVCVCMYACMS